MPGTFGPTGVISRPPFSPPDPRGEQRRRDHRKRGATRPGEGGAAAVHGCPRAHQIRLIARLAARSENAEMLYRIMLLVATFADAAAVSDAVDKSVYMDAAQPVEARVTALLMQMTNEEKQAQTIHLTGGLPAVVKEKWGKLGLGAYPSLGHGTAAGLALQNELQAYFLNTSRLAIPVTFHSETLHSPGGMGTMFPMPCLQGATWDAPLVLRRSIAPSSERSGARRRRRAAAASPLLRFFFVSVRLKKVSNSCWSMPSFPSESIALKSW